MRVGVISDIHANKVALDAVLDDLPSVDALVCAGDVVGYNPWPAECVDVLRDMAMPTVMGNHDRMVVTNRNFRGNPMARAGIKHARSALNEPQHAWLAALPPDLVLFDGALKLVHGHPDDPDHYTYPEEFGPGLLRDERALIMGHTHVQYSEIYETGMVVNPGSVGQPRDGDPRAAYAVVDLAAITVEERRVTYDIEAVQAAIEDAGLPTRTGTRLAKGR